MTFGVDYSSARPSIATLRKNDVRFVCRYVDAIVSEYNLSAAEATSLLAANIAIVPVFEREQSRAVGGLSAGVNDAKAAEAFLVKCGLPADSPVYFTVDFNPTATEMEFVKDYFRGVCSIHSVVNVGVYGGYYTVRTLYSYGLVGYVWQTLAWSNGQWFSSADIRQERDNVSWAGGAVDYNTAMSRDYGQYPRPHSPVAISEVGGDSKMLVLTPESDGPAIVLPVPTGAKHAHFYADPGFRTQTQPQLRVGVDSPWSEHSISPSWGNPKTVPVDGAAEVTIARVDSGQTPVTVAFGA